MLGKTFFFAAFLIGLGTSSLMQGRRLSTGGAFPVIRVSEKSFDPAAPPSLVFSPTTVPNGVYGSAYKSQTLKASGGKAPYSFSVSAGNLPTGMFLSADGVL